MARRPAWALQCWMLCSRPLDCGAHPAQPSFVFAVHCACTHRVCVAVLWQCLAPTPRDPQIHVHAPIRSLPHHAQEYMQVKQDRMDHLLEGQFCYWNREWGLWGSGAGGWCKPCVFEPPQCLVPHLQRPHLASTACAGGNAGMLMAALVAPHVQTYTCTASNPPTLAPCRRWRARAAHLGLNQRSGRHGGHGAARCAEPGSGGQQACGRGGAGGGPCGSQ